MSKTTELKPCPVCEDCGASLPPSINEEYTAEEWHTRAEVYITHPITGEPLDKSQCKRVITQMYARISELKAIVSVLTDAEHLAKTGKDLKDALNDLWKAEQSEDEENLDGLNDTVSDYWKGLNSAAYDLRKRASNLRLLIEEKPQREMK